MPIWIATLPLTPSGSDENICAVAYTAPIGYKLMKRNKPLALGGFRTGIGVYKLVADDPRHDVFWVGGRHDHPAMTDEIQEFVNRALCDVAIAVARPNSNAIAVGIYRLTCHLSKHAVSTLNHSVCVL
jgi:hypothetical protein